MVIRVAPFITPRSPVLLLLLVCLGFVFFVCVASSRVEAQSKPKPRPLFDLDSWWTQETASGDWSGVRTGLQKWGVTPNFDYTADMFGNPLGGESNGFAFAHVMEGSLIFDLETIAGLDGLTFVASGAWATGSSLSEEHVGNIFDTMEIFNGDSLRLVELYLEQSLWDEALTVKAGRVTVGNDFAFSPLYYYYISAAIDENPLSILINTPSFTTDPFAQWGLVGHLKPHEDFYFKAGVFNADPAVQDDDAHGVDFRLNPEDGVLTVAQVGYNATLGSEGRPLPGHYALGFIHDSSTFERLDDPDRSETGNVGLYLMADQMVYREADAKHAQGLIPWAALTIAPQQSINTLPFAAYGGALYHGLIPGRERDTTGLAVYYGRFSDDLVDQSYELVFEANYQLQLTPWFYVTPDVQYVVRPNGTGTIPNALVIGAEVGIDF